MSIYDLGYDPEAVVQDADLELAALQAVGRRVARLRARGICCHSSSVGLSADGTIYYPEQVGMRPGQQRCTDLCGRLFDSVDDMYADADRWM